MIQRIIKGQLVDIYLWPPEFSEDKKGRACWRSTIKGEVYGEFVRLDDWTADTQHEAAEVLLEQAKESIRLILAGVVQDIPKQSAN